MRAIQHYVISGFIVCHLLLVACGAFTVTFGSGQGIIERAINSYGYSTGAGNGYGFFSPAIPNQIIATTTTVNSIGEETVNHLGIGREEIDFRLSTMLLLLAKVNVPDLTSRALAAYMFGQSPETKFVNVTFSQYIVPSMADFRAGRRPYFDEFYSSDYVLKADLEK